LALNAVFSPGHWHCSWPCRWFRVAIDHWARTLISQRFLSPSRTGSQVRKQAPNPVLTNCVGILKINMGSPRHKGETQMHIYELLKILQSVCSCS